MHILNKMAGLPLHEPPPTTHARYDHLNSLLRARFAAAAILRSFTAGNKPSHVAMQEEVMTALGNGRMRALDRE